MISGNRYFIKIETNKKVECELILVWYVFQIGRKK